MGAHWPDVVNAKRARTLVLVAAIVLGWVIVMIELGTAMAPGLSDLVGAPLQAVPGIGIPALVLVDIPLAFTLTLFGLGFVVPHGLLGRTQGCATLIVSLIVLLGGCLTVLLAFGLLMVMLALIGSFFGIVVYLALWGNFAREAAAVILAFLLTSKLVIGASLIVSNQRYLQNRGLVLLWLTSLIANVIVAFLHGLLPRPVVSILDAVAAIILAILGIIWAVLLLVGAVISIVRVLQLGKGRLGLPGFSVPGASGGGPSGTDAAELPVAASAASPPSPGATSTGSG
jgi:hypothetical protein